MTNEQKQVMECMRAIGDVIPDKPGMPDATLRQLRVRLLAEELLELCEAFGIDLTIQRNVITGIFTTPLATNLIGAYDALLDIKYLSEGGGVLLGLDLEPGFAEVHRANMSKVTDGLRRPDGKWAKGPNYYPPRLDQIILAQMDKSLRMYGGI